MQSLLKNIAREICRALRIGDIGVEGAPAQRALHAFASLG
jgi:hypothetical protein